MKAKEYWNDSCKNNTLKSPADIMIEFAKYYCTEQARIISEKATASVCGSGEYWAEVDKDSILNAYDLNNIK